MASVSSGIQCRNRGWAVRIGRAGVLPAL